MTQTCLREFTDLEMKRDAIISDCGTFRFSLSRSWDKARPAVCIIGLNPSVADAQEDDPTIRRCIGFAKRWGYGTLFMVNLFAYRATDPSDLHQAISAGVDMEQKLNNDHILSMASGALLTVCAWGGNKVYGRDIEVLQLLKEMGVVTHALVVNSDGTPKHPLYIKGDTIPTPWDGQI